MCEWNSRLCGFAVLGEGDEEDACEDDCAADEALLGGDFGKEEVGDENGEDGGGGEGDGVDAEAHLAQYPVVEIAADDDVDCADDEELPPCERGCGKRTLTADKHNDAKEKCRHDNPKQKEVVELHIFAKAFDDGDVEGVADDGGKGEQCADLEGDVAL